MGKDLILKTLRHEKTDQTPWVPFAGVHAGKLKGYNCRGDAAGRRQVS